MARKKIEIVTIEVNGEFVEAKECTKCGEVKALSEYHSDKRGLAGKRSPCKLCESVRKGDYYQENKEKIVEQARKYRQENKEKIVKYRQENKERISEQKTRYYQENKERIVEQKTRYYQENKERIMERKTRYYQENKERISEQKKRYRQENKHVSVVANQRRRARKRQLPDTLTVEQSKELLQRGCALTGSQDDIHRDHFIPLSWGYGGTVIENMIPLRGDLNISKKDANPFEWIKRKDIREQIDIDRWNATVKYLAELNGMTAQEYEEYVYWCEENKRDLTKESA
ncbi:hypothetical protein COK15_28360 [Bacillus cereus]|uniref:hypothetical protein n=1 Tax=Bacillus cereus TaxID=1396 RepID=UPI000BF54139|nr:hypothetical protein [Bacillus cereus]PFQ72453.1 hypothetical protein COK15_28360 [Bacillus cereus]